MYHEKINRFITLFALAVTLIGTGSIGLLTLSPALAQEEGNKASETARAAAELGAAKAAKGWEATKSGVESGSKAVGEVSSDVWKGTKQGSSEAWDAAKETSKDAAEYTAAKTSQGWKATKSGTGKVVDGTSEAASKGWEKTKELGSDAADYTVKTYEQVKEKITDEDEPTAPAAVPVEDKSVN